LRLEKFGKWVLQLRGGSDIALRRQNPETAKQILEILSECDEVITDNDVNINYIKELGLGEKIASIAPVPGTGGLDTDVEIEDIVLPSKKERLILWPKAYESPWSKALPVMEALTLAWNEIKPCKVYMASSIPETETWFWTLPEEIRENCTLVRRVPRNELMELMKKARVLLAPSLVDGVPNTLYEAMINATFPIVSPLDTIQLVVKNEMNVLFARNLYPEEISQALVRAMSDDVLVDNAAKNNLVLVKKIASRRTISRQVIEYYDHIACRYRKEYSIEHANAPLVSVITPTYNRADYLPETIESVLSQDYPKIEYIVLDDGSKDHTLEVLKKYEGKIIIETHANMGETETVNKGFRMAKGEFICVVNSDDPILPGAITKMISALMAEPDALAAYPDWVEIDPLSRPVKEMRLPDYDIYNMLNDFNVVMGPGNIFRRAVLEKYGFRDTKRRYTGDLEFWFRLASHGKLLHVPEILATHRTHPHSTSVSNKSSIMAEELLSMTKSIFASGILPKEIQDKRSQILSYAYHTSTFYCPNEPDKKEKYATLSILYNPQKSILYKISRVFSFIAHKIFNIFQRIFWW
jgi:glycosyltransferase involved in cell wall biosynthesis